MWFFNVLKVLFNEGKKSKTTKITVSASVLILVVIAAFLFGGEVKAIKTQIDKIPAIEEVQKEHAKVIALIPDMKKGIDQLVKKFIDKGMEK